MRVGLLIYGDLETVSGGYLYDRKLVEFLRRQGDEVELVSLAWRDYPRHLSDNWSGRLARRLRALKVDVLVQDELNHPSLFRLNRRLRPELPYPLVGLVHHLRCSEARPAWQNWAYRQVERRYLDGLDGYICNSQATRQAVVKVCPPAAARPCVVAYPAADHLPPSGLSEAEILARAQSDGPLRLLFIGNLIERKGLHLLIEALARLPAGTATLAVVGRTVETAYADRLERRARQAGLAETVCFLGYLPPAELRQQLLAAQALVVPSSYEGFGIVYLEGMGYGLPALAGDQGAAGELITQGENGFLLPGGGPAALERLTEHLHRLITDRQLLGRLSLAAWQRYRRHPGWEQSGAEIRVFLDGMARG